MRLQARLLGLALAGLVLSACGAPASGGGPQPLNPLSRWRLQVEPQIDRIALAVHETGQSKGREERMAAAYDDVDVLVFGHSHIPWDTTTATGLRLLNPGRPPTAGASPTAPT